MSRPAGTASRFFSRFYGSYTREQLLHAHTELRKSAGRLLDPMSGAGPALPTFITAGFDVIARDINPVAVALVELRSPALTTRANALRVALDAVLTTAGDFQSSTLYSDAWLTPEVAAWIARYSAAARVFAGNRFTVPERRVLIHFPLLAARRLVSYTSSDNAAWIKPGGRAPDVDIGIIIREAFELWVQYLATTYPHVPTTTLAAETRDACAVGDVPTFDAIVCSPPYANRLDYARMWAPEAAVYEALHAESLRSLSARMIGTTITRGQKPSADAVAALPRSIKNVLERIREDRAKASESYYFPFFANYAIKLAAAVKGIAAQLAHGGTGIFFVRDTPRGDILFPTGVLVQTVLRTEGFGVRAVDHVVRSHIGMRRRREHAALQGLAQREWFITFRR